MNVKEILDRVPPTILYHYTTQKGLLGIITDKEIWATHTQYLNDVREFRHAIDLVNEELSSMRSEGQYQRQVEWICEMQEALTLKHLETINVCVCSFSEHGDVLSQWRAYGQGPSGFSIGFSGVFLKAIAKRLEFWLVPVLYEENEQRSLVRTLLDDVLTENLRRPSKFKEQNHIVGQPVGGNLLAYLNRYAPILKHKSFAEEREWRIITRPLFCQHERFGYRVGPSMLAPYFRIPLSSQEQPFAIEQIIVGPTPNPDQSRNSVRGLLTRNDLETAMYNSQVPYRNW